MKCVKCGGKPSQHNIREPFIVIIKDGMKVTVNQHGFVAESK